MANWPFGFVKNLKYYILYDNGFASGRMGCFIFEQEYTFCGVIMYVGTITARGRMKFFSEIAITITWHDNHLAKKAPQIQVWLCVRVGSKLCYIYAGTDQLDHENARGLAEKCRSHNQQDHQRC